jgi:hypothetical protein
LETVIFIRRLSKKIVASSYERFHSNRTNHLALMTFAAADTAED